MSKKTSKQALTNSSPKATRKQEDRNSYLQKNPTWKFQRADKKHERWSMKNCPDFCADILDKLVDYEGQTWSEITIDAKKQNHHISVSYIIKEAQKRLGELKIIEDELFSLRLNGTCRLYGILTDGVFHIIWYDCNHEICPSNKKHT